MILVIMWWVIVGSLAPIVSAPERMIAAWGGHCAAPDWLDFEVVTIFAIALAGVALVYRDAKAERAEAEAIRELTSRVATVEAATAVDGTSTIAERVAALEASLDLAQRLATIEARIDHQPIRQTRAKNGRFAKEGDPLAIVTKETGT